MKAKMCDRCGAAYQIKLQKYRITEIVMEGSRSRQHSVDLCDECQRALTEFLEEKNGDSKDRLPR